MIPSKIDSFHSLYKRFKRETGSPFSLTTLRTHTPKHYKRARKESDLCDYCENEQPLQKQLKQANDTKQELTNNNQSTTDIQYSIMKITESLEFIQHHKQIANIQREKFRAQRDGLKKGECIVLFDFKENITVGRGPRETNKDFYNKTQRSLFGCAVYYKDKQTLPNTVNNKHISISQTKHQYVHFISEVLAHDGLFVCDCLTKLLTLSWMKKFHTIYFWSDCGPHFRSYEVVNHTVFELSKKFKVTTSHHFWGEKHGKNSCDSEFSVLTQWLETITNRIKITTTNELIESFRIKEAENQMEGGMIRTFIEYKRDQRPTHVTKSNFDSIQTYHSFSKFSHDRINCHVQTDDSKPVIQFVSFGQHADHRKTKHASSYTKDFDSKLVGRNSLSAWRKGKEGK